MDDKIAMVRTIMDGLTEEQWADREFMCAMAHAWDALKADG